MAAGAVDLGWLVMHRFPLHDYGKAFTLLGRKGDSGAIKAVFQYP